MYLIKLPISSDGENYEHFHPDLSWANEDIGLIYVPIIISHTFLNSHCAGLNLLLGKMFVIICSRVTHAILKI